MNPSFRTVLRTIHSSCSRSSTQVNPLRDHVAVDGTDEVPVVPIVEVDGLAPQKFAMRGLAEKVGLSHRRFKGRLTPQLVPVFLGVLSPQKRPEHETLEEPECGDGQPG